MSVLQEYKKYAPYTANELVDAINHALRRKGEADFSKRTLRFYIAQGVVPPPIGSTKFARYGFEHFLAVLAARALRDRGIRLDKVANELKDLRAGKLDKYEPMVEEWFGQQRIGALYGHSVMEQPRGYGESRAGRAKSSNPGRLLGTSVQRISLTTRCTLELTGTPDVVRELRQAYQTLHDLIEKVSEQD